MPEFAKAFRHKSFIKRFWAVVDFEDTNDEYDWEEDKIRKIKRKEVICDFVWDIIAWH